MEVVNVTVVDTPEVVAVNVAVGFGTVVNSDATYSATVNSGDTLVVPDSEITNSEATVLTSLPATIDFEVPDSVLGLIMPHIDSVLRKIQHLEPVDIASQPTFVINDTGLSARELEIIHWIKSGKTNQEIGVILKISQNTVKSHLKRVFHKMNVTRRAQAVAILLNK